MTVNIQNLYGCHDPDIDLLAQKLTNELSLVLETRDSSFWGDYYIDKSELLAECRLYRNADPMFRSDMDPPEEYWFEPTFQEYPSLLSTFASLDAAQDFHEKLQNAGIGFDLLRNESLPLASEIDNDSPTAFDDYIAFHNSRSATWELYALFLAASSGVTTLLATVAWWFFNIPESIAFCCVAVTVAAWSVHLFLYFWRRNAWW